MRLLQLQALLGLLLLASCTGPPPVGEARRVEVPDLELRLERLAEELERDREALHVPGLAVAIVKDDRVVFARGFGLADLQASRPVTPETLFAVGSTTKAFTATLVGMLADEGRLDFDDPVTEHLPWFALPIDSAADEAVTLRDLLGHRTGFARMDILWAGARVPPEEVLRTALRAEPWAPFRKEFHYNNIMFLAAGEACAAAAGRSWDELVRERIFEPLGMRSTLTSTRAAQQDARLALGYRWDEEQQAFVREPIRVLDSIAPAGAINSNVLDMAQWLRFLLGRGELEGRRLISESSLLETWERANEVGPGVGYGLGWFLRSWEGQPYLEHGGNIDGFAAEVALLPESSTGLVLLANVTATPLQDTLPPKAFEALFGAAPVEAVAPEPEDLERYTGVYVADFMQFQGVEFTVLVQDDRLVVDVPGQTTYELEPPDPQGKRAFALTDQIAVSFEEEAGEVVLMKLYQAGYTFELPRRGYVPPGTIPPEELQPYLGLYSDPANGKTFEIALHGKRLAVLYPEQGVAELHEPDARGRWLYRMSDQLGVEFQHDDAGAIQALIFHERGSERLCPRVGVELEAPPSLDEVLGLRRGEDFERRLAELGLCRLLGTIRLVHCGIEGWTETIFDARGRFRDETDLAPFARTRTAFDGARVRFDSTLQPFQELEGKYRAQALWQSPAFFYGDWRERFDAAEVLRVVQGAEGKSYLVKLVKGEAPPLLVHVDAVSGDVTRVEMQELVEGAGSFPKTITLENWKEVEGLRLPLRVTSEDDATGRVVIEFRGLETGLEEDERIFELSAELYGN